MASSHSLSETYKKQEFIKAWESSGGQMPANLKKIVKNLSQDKLELSSAAKEISEKLRALFQEEAK